MPNVNSIARDDQLFFGVGLLTFIFSFIAFAHASVHLFGFSASDTISAWHGVGVLAGILVLVALAIDAVVVMSPNTLAQLPVSGRVLAAGAAVLALLFFIIRWLTLPGETVNGHHFGYSLYWGGYITLILNIVMIVVGVRAIQAAGEALPWQQGGAAATPPPVPPAA